MKIRLKWLKKEIYKSGDWRQPIVICAKAVTVVTGEVK